ncbi:HAD-IA family hydrolase [archaeon]|jgi:HAD superfamily hydrolase (TIGR01509 family)|nr:HAD-IA family hydrolase [archaeon]MBT4417540.1 HAD-IA family hydrolase [archaeon]
MKAIIFDWGGVLAPSDNKVAIIRLKKNFDFDENAFQDYFNKHEDDLCDTNEYKDFLSKASKKFNIPKESIVNALNADPPDEDFEIAKELSKKYKLYLLSNQLKFRTDYIKKTFDLDFFDEVFFSNEIGLKKPSEKAFEYVLKKIGQKSEDCLFIDDYSPNIAVAKKLGFNVILFKGFEEFKVELDRLL